MRIAEDITIEGEDDEAQFVVLGPLAQWVKDRGITLECSPSSNLQTGAFAAWGSTMADHPFDMLYQLGFRVTVNTDNRLMSATTLTRELGILVDTFGYDADDLLAFQLNAAEAAFLPLEDREELVERIVSRIRPGMTLPPLPDDGVAARRDRRRLARRRAARRRRARRRPVPRRPSTRTR